MPSVVNSWNEWDNLREVMVGSLENKPNKGPLEPATQNKFGNSSKYNNEITYTCKDDMAEAKECLANYVRLLKKEGINVVRPETRDFSKEIITPTFSSPSENGITCPRDVFTVFGNHIIEAPMSWRSRYFENQCYRSLMMDYMTRDPRMRWTCAPKPLLTDASFAGPLTLDRQQEILFDAADMRRFGKDVFCQDAHTMNTRGIDWVSRTLKHDGFRVHTVDWKITEEHPVPSFSHLDAKITPVDEDMLLWSTGEELSEKQLNFFVENDWKVLEAGTRQQCVSPEDQCGRGIHLNMLTISPSTVMVEEGETKLIKSLREEGIDCIPLKFAPAYRYGGSLNCYTLDIHRDGNCKSYFPTLDRIEKASEDLVETALHISKARNDDLPPKRLRNEFDNFLSGKSDSTVTADNVHTSSSGSQSEPLQPKKKISKIVSRPSFVEMC